MKVSIYIRILLLFIITLSCNRLSGPSSTAERTSKLHEVLNNGVLRVVTEFNSTSYFIYRGQPMGYQYEMLQELANHLGVKLEVIVNNDLDEKFRLLQEDKVDLIAVNLVVTKERKKIMNFTVPHTQTRQVLVQRKPKNWQYLDNETIDANLIRNQLDLALKTIYVPRNSAYSKRLYNLSEEIGDSIKIVEVDDDIEKLIEKVAKGDIDYTVSDENIAKVYESYYNNIDIATPVSFTQNLAWAMAKGTDDLRQVIDNWLIDFKKTKKYANIYSKYYLARHNAQFMEGDFFLNASGKISPYDALIKEYSEEIGWDWRLVASLIYQESRFNPQAKSWAGAYGLMQLMPNTAERFGIEPESAPKQQIRAGVMYVKWLDDKLSDVKDRNERYKFVLAAYNVGLGHVLDSRALAVKNGKNPNLWDKNVDDYLLSKSDPKFYTDPVVKYGYCRGTEPYRYVTEVLDRYMHYKNLVVK
jgi:membrane-bound lytic murein transglycosylase F